MTNGEEVEWQWRYRAGSALWFVLAPVVLLLAFLTGSLPLSGVGCLLLAWNVVATAVSVAGREAVVLRLHAPGEVRALEPFEISAILENPTDLWPVAAASLDVDLVASAGRLPLASLRRCFVEPRSALSLKWRASIARRGSCWISARLSLGLTGSWIVLRGEGTPRARTPLWVLPEEYVLRRRALEIISSSSFSPGSTLKVAADATEEFLNLREWRPGEGMRRVDWKSSCRMNRTVLREYRDPALGDVLIVIDTCAGAQALSRWRLERAISFGAALAGQFSDAGYRVGVKTAGPAPVDITLDPRQRSRTDLLRALANVVSTPHAVDVRTLLRHSSNRAFGLVLFVSLDSTPVGPAGAHVRTLRPEAFLRYLSASHRAIRTADEEGRAIASPPPSEPKLGDAPIGGAGRARALLAAALFGGFAHLFDFGREIPGAPVLGLAAAGVAILAATALGKLSRSRVLVFGWLVASSLVPGSAVSLSALLPAFYLVLKASWREQDLVAAGTFGRGTQSPYIITARADAPYRPAIMSSLSRRPA